MVISWFAAAFVAACLRHIRPAAGCQLEVAGFVETLFRFG